MGASDPRRVIPRTEASAYSAIWSISRSLPIMGAVYRMARPVASAPMARRSAGILLHRGGAGGREVLLVHPGGPFWARRDDGAWSIPKGEYDDGEDPMAAALREFEEELGSALAHVGELVALGEVRQRNRKVVTAWAAQGALDASAMRSNTFTMEWPPRSGQRQEFPEIDRAEWFGLARAREKLVEAQAAFVDRLEDRLQAAT